MIQSFKSKALKALWVEDDGSRLPAQQVKRIRRILQAIDTAAVIPDDLLGDISWRLHQLKGSLQGLWSLTVNGNYRIVFLFENGHAYYVDYVDYH